MQEATASRLTRVLKLIRAIVIPLGTTIVLAIMVSTLLGRAGVRQTANGMVPAPLAVGEQLLGSRPLPNIPLIDEHGHRTSLAAYRGRFVVFAPAMTLCKEVCPMTTGSLMELVSRLRRQGLASKVVVAEVSVDPWRDSPARLRAYKRMTGASFTMLTGSVESIGRLWKRLGVFFKRVPEGRPPAIDWWTHRPERFDVQHTDGLFILDPAGDERIVVGGMPQVEGRLSPTLHKLLDAEGEHNLAHPETPWTASQVMDDVDWLTNRLVPASSLPHSAPPSAGKATRELQGSPAALASLHSQASRLLGSFGALRRRLSSLRGYPVVINVWAQWCGPCKFEFPLFASASAAYGRRVAFLGFDANDPEASQAQAFLAKHHVSYPSYRGEIAELASLAAVENVPDTIYLDSRGRVLHIHIGQYETEGTLLADIQRYALKS